MFEDSMDECVVTTCTGVRCIIECNEANKPLPKRSELPVSHLGFDGVTVYVPKREPAKVLHSPKGLFQLFSKSYSAEERIALATSMMGGQIASQGRRPTHVVCSDAKHPKYKACLYFLNGQLL